MTPERWQLVKSIFDRVVECEAPERVSLIGRLCGGDADLRAAVESLVAADGAAESLPSPAKMLDTAGLSAVTDFPPDRFGNYRIVRLLAEGGMGAVYEAEQQQPRRRVAMKVIRPGWATPQLLRRFEVEAHALGRLQHPGIAQIYEAGTADTGSGQQPYFVMEFISGQNLLEHANTRNLEAPQRMLLLARVCDAIHHAHQRGIIHRDLKPGNILVDETGQPKVLDFGVARVTDSDAHVTRHTDAGQLVGTVAYMSPEQVLADPLEIDTRSDVYSLGVILYQMLAGRLPYGVRGKLHESLRAIQEEDPAPLGCVDRSFRGDVETIAAKALEKDKSRRYASAAELAEDLRRCLQNQPLLARAPTSRYLLWKFARRHRALVAGVAAVVTALAGGVVVSTSQAMRARRAEQAALLQRDRASRAEQSALAAERSALDGLRRATSAEQSATMERDRAVAAEAQALNARNNALAEKQRADTEAATATAVSDFLQQDILAQVNMWTQAFSGGLGQQSPANAELGQTDDAPDPDLKVRTALDRAARRIGVRFRDQPLVEAAIRHTIATSYASMRLFAEAQTHLNASIELRRKAAGDQHPDVLKARRLLATYFSSQGKHTEAAALAEQVILSQRQKLGDVHPDTLDSMNVLGNTLFAQGKYDQANSIFRQILKIDPTHGNTLFSLGTLLMRQQKYDQAELLLERSLDSARARGVSNPATANVMRILAQLYSLSKGKIGVLNASKAILDIQQRVLGESNADNLTTMGSLAVLYRTSGNSPAAERILRNMLAILQGMKPDEQERMAASLRQLAAIFYNAAWYSAAHPFALKAFEIQSRLGGEEHSSTLNAGNTLAVTSWRLGRYGEAKALYDKNLAIERRLLGEEHEVTILTRTNLALLHISQQRFPDAEAIYRDVVEIQRRTLGETAGRTLYTTEMLAVTLRLRRQFKEAESLYTKVLDIRRRTHGAEQGSTLTTMANLASILREQGRNGDAAKIYQDILTVQQRVLGMDDESTIRTMLSLALAYRAQHRLSEAELLYEKMHAARRRTLGDNHPDTLSTQGELGKIYQMQGNHAQSDAILTGLLLKQRLVLGEDHGDTVLTLSRLGVGAVEQGRYAEAEKLLRETLERIDRGKSNRVSRPWCESALGASIAGQERFAEAEPLILSGYQGILRQMSPIGRDWGMMHWVETRVVQLYEDWGRPDQAAEWKRKLSVSRTALDNRPREQ